MDFFQMDLICTKYGKVFVKLPLAVHQQRDTENYVNTCGLPRGKNIPSQTRYSRNNSHKELMMKPLQITVLIPPVSVAEVG